MKILDLDVLSAEIRAKLNAAGIDTLAALTELHTSPRRCLELAQETKMSVGEIHQIISAALFCQIKGLSLHHSSLLVKIGIDSTVKLANARPAWILQEMQQFNKLQSNLASLPEQSDVKGWIEQAQHLVLQQSDNYEF